MIIFLLAASVLAAQPKADENHKVFAADELEVVVVRTDRGKVEVKGSRRLDVQVEKTDAKDPKICVVVMEPDQSRKTLRLEVKKRVAFGSQECRTGFRVELPQRLAVRAASGRGDIFAADLEGDLSADSGTGNISLKNLRGTVKAHAGTGEVSGEITAERGAAIETGTGGVKLRGLKGALDVNTGTGEVTLEWATAPKPGAALRASVNTGTSNASVFFPAGSKIKAELKSGTGSSTNELGDSSDADFVMSMESGSGNMSILKTGKTKK